MFLSTSKNTHLGKEKLRDLHYEEKYTFSKLNMIHDVKMFHSVGIFILSDSVVLALTPSYTLLIAPIPSLNINVTIGP